MTVRGHAGAMLALALVAAGVIAVGRGAVAISPGEVIAAIGAKLGIGESSAQKAAILGSIRLPRVVLAMLVGAALGIAGATLQGVVRNPLADPTLVGVSGGAALGAIGWLVADRRYPSLSGGEQQRVQLARVLAQLADRRRAALLLDEPAAALDLRQQRLVTQIARASAAHGHAVVLVAHDPAFVARTADRVVVLRAGRVIADAAPAEALTDEILARAFDL